MNDNHIKKTAPFDLTIFDDTRGFETTSKSPRDSCVERVTFKRGDTITVGKTRWEVEKTYGITAYLIKAGSKGKKLYTIRSTSFDPKCCVEILEVWPGSGDIKTDVPPAANGCAVNGGAVFAGAQSRSQKPSRRR